MISSQYTQLYLKYIGIHIKYTGGLMAVEGCLTISCDPITRQLNEVPHSTVPQNQRNFHLAINTVRRVVLVISAIA